MSSIIASSISEELKNYNGEWKPVGFSMPENFDISITLFQSLYLQKTHTRIKRELVFAQAIQNYIVKSTTLVEYSNTGNKFEEMFSEDIDTNDETENVSNKELRKTFRLPQFLLVELDKLHYLYHERTHTSISNKTIFTRALQDFFSYYLTEEQQDESVNNKDWGNLENKVTAEKRYWFVTASPKVWSLSEWPNDGIQGYSLYNDRGNKRRIFQNFLDAAAGDPVICYESTPTKQIKCIAEVVDKTDGKELNIKLTKTLASPIELADFKDHPELQAMEFFKGNQGSFFKLTKTEYEALMDLISETNQDDVKEGLPKYTDAEFLHEVFTTADTLEEMKHLLRRKKNIILQGAPGVGKTFSAKRLAYAMMGEKNDGNIALVQFHQNYSYEDFIMGYKPEGGDFVLKEGVFFRFCRKALSDPEHDYFFIIDEINRGNMSKIFGELLMLIEKDYRGTYATLPYREERFTVPKNVYLIGMMNTADRSLAMIDYALRRRFSFVEMKPGFDSEGFRVYQQKLNLELFDRVVELIKQLNDAICDDDTLGSGFQIGHSYLCGIMPEECNEALLKEIVKYDIRPTLSEYWFDDTDKAEDWAKKFNNLFA